MPITMKRRIVRYDGVQVPTLRRQNLYAKRLEGLQRVLDVQRLVHNWVRPHWGLGRNMTPAMAIGYCNRPISMHELLTQRGFSPFIY